MAPATGPARQPSLARSISGPRREAGFTLVELMISLVIFSIAVAGVLAVAVSMTQGYREQRQAVMAEDAARGPLDFIADALRQVSPAVTDPAQVFDTNACTQGAITVTNSTSASDQLDIVYASGGIVTSTGVAVDQASGTIAVQNGSNFFAKDYVLITDFAKGHVFQISDATATSITLPGANSCGYVFAYTAGALVVRVQHATFTVAADAANNNMPTLWMDPDGAGTATREPVAEGIEDMQIAVGVDADSVNGIVEGTPSASGDEWHYNDAGDLAPAGTIRAVRVTLIARTTQPQFGNLNTYQMPTAEDRTTASVFDAYRRRTLRTIVEMRNITGSP